ncbi:MAG: hypothetical protein J3R72DRAFT_506436 [Linnemannia gamsii]|nr:MAG: hypothetical protein J3R72DRAFT_506436 [Linnemannia gamsii]
MSIGYRSYFEVPGDNQLAHELLLRTVEEKRPPITLTSATKYLKWNIPVPTPPVKKAHYDIVLGVSTKNLDLKAVEAIIITIQHKIGDDSTAKSEVITPHELSNLCSPYADSANTSCDEGSKNSEITTIATDDTYFRWKLHEKLIHLGEGDPVQMVMEFKTWQGESTDYGSIKLHFTEILTGSQALYMSDPRYREHEPFICSVDINRTGCSQLDADLEGPKRVTDYTISGDGSHVLVTTVAEDHRFSQLWTFKEPPLVMPSRLSKESNNSQQPSHAKGSARSKPFQPLLVAWMQLPRGNTIAYGCCLSWNGSQIACIDLGGLDGGSDKKEKVEEYGVEEETPIPAENPRQNATAFYKVNISCTEVPVGVVDGSGFMSFDSEEQCPAPSTTVSESRNYFPDTIYYSATTLQVREYKKTTQRLKEEKSPIVDVTADSSSKSQTVVSEAFGRRQDRQQQSQEQEQEKVDANTGENRAVMEMFKQFQEEQRLMRKEQIEAERLEQREVYKTLLMAQEE